MVIILMTKNYKWTFRFSLLTIPLLLIVVFFMGGGHGTYIPAIGLFPFGLISTVFFDSITIPFVVLGIIQYPTYGFIIDKARRAQKSKVVLPILIFVHIILSILIIKLTSENLR